MLEVVDGVVQKRRTEATNVGHRNASHGVEHDQVAVNLVVRWRADVRHAVEMDVRTVTVDAGGTAYV